MMIEISTHTYVQLAFSPGRKQLPWGGPATVQVTVTEEVSTRRSSGLKFHFKRSDDVIPTITVEPSSRLSLTEWFVLGPGRTTHPTTSSTYHPRYVFSLKTNGKQVDPFESRYLSSATLTFRASTGLDAHVVTVTEL